MTADETKGPEYFNEQISFGTRIATISANTYEGPFTTRLFINSGETATTIVRHAKTLKGAKLQAKRMLGLHWSKVASQWVTIPAGN